MNNYHIVRIPILPFRMVNAHLIVGQNGCVLVDAGLPGSEKKIESALKRNGLTFKDIKLIVITHAHVDHAGSAAKLRELSGAPIVAGKGDVNHLSREVPMTFCPTGLFGRLFIKTQLMFQEYVGFVPDILLEPDQSLNMQSYGVDGAVMSTPGHTDGSISVVLSSHDALVGDLLASGILLGGIMWTGRAKQPPFEDDPIAVSHQLQRLVNEGYQQFYIGHGGPVRAKEVQRHAKWLMSRKPCCKH